MAIQKVSTSLIEGDAITEASIADDAVESEHLNNNVISGQTEISSGLADADELLYSDGGTIKKVGLDTLQSHIRNSVTAAELSLLDGGTSVGSSITLADADGIIVNDGGTMKTMPASDVKTYVGGSNLVFLVENSVAGGVHLSTAFSSTYITSKYERYLITIQDLDFNNNAVELRAQISDDNASTYKTTSYRCATQFVEHNGSTVNTGSESSDDDFILRVTQVANEATHTMSGCVWLHNPSNSATFPQVTYDIGYYAEDDYARRAVGHGVYAGGAIAFNNIKFMPSGGVWNSGKFVLYGVKNS